MFWITTLSFTAILGFITYFYFNAGYVQLTAYSAGLTVAYALICPIAWKIADWLRKLARPTMYITGGFFDALGKRFFWAYGPQINTLIVILIATLYALRLLEINSLEKAELIVNHLQKMDKDQIFPDKQNNWAPAKGGHINIGVFGIKMVYVPMDGKGFWFSKDYIGDKEKNRILDTIKNITLLSRNADKPPFLLILNTLDSLNGSIWKYATRHDWEKAVESGHIQVSSSLEIDHTLAASPERRLVRTIPD